MDNIFDISYIGTGPSTMFSVMTLLDNNYEGSICIIDKGKSLKERQPNEVINGSFGAGCFSDSKLSAALDVGGVIENLTQEKLDYYCTLILNNINKYLPKEIKLDWDITKYYDVSNTSLNWNTHKTCHVGTDYGRYVYTQMENNITNSFNVTTKFKTNIIDVIKENNIYKLITDNNEIIYTKKVVLATGQKDNLPGKLIEKFNLESIPRAFQLGVRVVDEINDKYRDIIKANYDFKFVKLYNYNNIKIKIRTFCCNSGNAHVCAEKSLEGFTCFNGHAYKKLDPNNNTVNYGIMCEIEGLNSYATKPSQIELMKQINSIGSWFEDNFEDINKEPVPKRKLLDGFKHLINYYPDEVIDALNDFVVELNKIVDLNKAKYLYPEVKLSGLQVKVNPTSFETQQPNLHLLGDCLNTRGIIKASIEGIMFAKYILGVND